MFELCKSLEFRVLFSVFFLFALNVPHLYGGETEELRKQIERQEKELDGVEKEIRQLRSGLQDLSEREKELSNRLDEIDARIEEKQNRLRRLRFEMQELNRQISAGEEQVRSKKIEKSGCEAELKKLMRAYYYEFNRNSAGWISSLFQSRPDKSYLLTEMMSVPVEEYRRTEKEIEKTITETEELRRKNRQLSGLKREVVSLQDEFIDKRNDQLSMLQEKQNLKQERTARLQGMEREKRELEALLESLRHEARSLEELSKLDGDFAAAKGNIPWPVTGEVVSYFGRQNHPTLDAHVFNRGIEIEVSLNSPVKAPAAGEVVFADSFRGRGQMVVIDHGNNYYTICGGLEDVFTAVGEMVKPGQEIGKSSGRFYFELGHELDPRDPIKWLR